jgi:hypothetical protein
MNRSRAKSSGIPSGAWTLLSWNLCLSRRCISSENLRDDTLEEIVEMKVLRQFALILTVLLPLVAPTMVCALPHAHLSRAERACCRQMSGHCGSGAMTTCKGCCQREVPTANTWNAATQPNSANALIDVSAVAAVHCTVLLPIPATLSGYSQWIDRSPPQSPPSAITVLRV